MGRRSWTACLAHPAGHVATRQAGRDDFRLRVKLRKTQCEHMFSPLPSNSDIARCIPRGNDVEDDAIRPRSGRAVLRLLLPSVRRRTCGLLPRPIRSQSAAAGSTAARRTPVLVGMDCFYRSGLRLWSSNGTTRTLPLDVSLRIEGSGDVLFGVTRP